MAIVWVTIGIVIGSSATGIASRFRTKSGTLLIDHSNPEKDVYRFEIDNLDNMKNKKRITLKINHNADLSHE